MIAKILFIWLHLFISTQALGEGYQVDNAADDLRYRTKSYTLSAFEDYILKNMGGQLSDGEKMSRAIMIADLVDTASEVFNTDQSVFLAMMRKESSFYYLKNLQGSGAAGLTQFTLSGLEEVFDQLAIRSKGLASQEARDFFISAYKDFYKKVKKNYSEIPSYDEIIKRFGDVNGFNIRRGVSKFKEFFAKNIPLQIAFGAVLLKTYAAAECKRYGENGCENWGRQAEEGNNTAKNSMNEIYRKALVRYNGDVSLDTKKCPYPVPNRQHKYCYAATIMSWANKLEKNVIERFKNLKVKLVESYMPDQFKSFLKLIHHGYNSGFEGVEIETVKDFNKNKYAYATQGTLNEESERLCSLEEIRYFVTNKEISREYKEDRTYEIPICYYKGKDLEISWSHLKVSATFSIKKMLMQEMVLNNPEDVMPLSLVLMPASSTTAYYKDRVESFLMNGFIVGSEEDKINMNSYSSDEFSKESSSESDINIEQGFTVISKSAKGFFYAKKLKYSFEYDEKSDSIYRIKFRH